MLSICMMASLQFSLVWSLPSRTHRPSYSNGAHSTTAYVRKHTSYVPMPILAPCVLPLCLACMLAKECLALAHTDQSQVSDPHATRISFASWVDIATSLLKKDKQAKAQGDFLQALLWYNQAILIIFVISLSFALVCLTLLDI